MEKMKKYNIDFDNEDVKRHFRRTINDPEKIQLNGPINPHIPDEFFERKCLASPDGICAMMTCECHEQDIEDLGDNDEPRRIEWFTGKCMNCNEPIKERETAFRIPLKNGGFIDCLCSANCAHEQFNFDPEAEEHILIELMRIYIDAYPIIRIKELEYESDKSDDSDEDL